MSDAPHTPTPPPGRVHEVLTPGEKLGEYTVEACMSYDILGSLYRVTDANAEEKTLFVLPKLLTDDENFMRRFKDLRDKLREMTHPSVISLADSIQVDGRICFVAEPFRGKSVPDYLGAAGIYPTYKNPQGIVRAHPSEESKDFTPEKIRKVARTMLEAIEHAHGKHTLHLNLTPSNVLLSESGETKVIGFGLYSIIGQQAIETLVSAGIPAVSLGPRNVRLNTADIIAPEVHLKQDPDTRADIYALGMSVYWMLTGLKPSANYRPPSGIVPGLDPGWDIFLARCLTREKAKRYANASAAIKDLDNLSSLTTAGYADDPSRTAAKGKSKKLPTRKLLVAGAAIVVIGAAAAFLAPMLLEEPVPEDAVPAESPFKRAENTPAFIIKVPHAGARVIVSQNNASFGVRDGELKLAAPAGKVKFTVTASGLTSRIVESAYDGKRTTTLFVKLAKNAGSLEITTAPGAEVALTDSENTRTNLGVADAQGKLLAAGIEAGTYTLEITKDKCKPAKVAGIEVKKGEKTDKNVPLEGAPATLDITSSPEGAHVTVNGDDYGTTPMTLDKLKPGTEFTIVFTKENYRAVTKKVLVDAGDKLTVKSGPMVPAMGGIEYDITFSGRPADAAHLSGLKLARSDDKLKSRDWAAASTLPKSVPVGHYLVKASHPDYESFQTAFLVKDEATTRVAIALRALPAPAEFSITPEKTKFIARVNNREYTDEFPTTIPADVPVHIEIEARDFEVWKTDIVARPRKPEPIAVSLRKLAPPVSGTAYDLPYLGIRLAWIPKGETRLGSPESEAERAAVEGPFTWAAFTEGYWMTSTEITQAQFEKVLGYNPSRLKRTNNPVDSVSYQDVLRFCKAINEREFKAGRLPLGFEYRLPNELEWEYACRAGTGTPYAFGDKAGPENGNFLGTYPTNPTQITDPSAATARPVASYAPNAYGLYDMHGNVREWVLEQYASHLPGGKRTNYNLTAGELTGTECFTRGGSFRMSAAECRSASRPAAPMKPDQSDDDLGFRLVLAPVPLP